MSAEIIETIFRRSIEGQWSEICAYAGLNAQALMTTYLAENILPASIKDDLLILVDIIPPSVSDGTLLHILDANPILSDNVAFFANAELRLRYDTYFLAECHWSSLTIFVLHWKRQV